MTAPCTRDEVLVVVDRQLLDGTDGPGPVARCAAVDAGDDGTAALEAAGFEPTGTARFGRSFVCRIDDRPAATERLALPGRGTYRETCADTPPTSAYWSYWVAAPGSCSWRYSSSGATTRRVEPGGAEGWSFALGSTPGRAPRPRTSPCDAVVTEVPVSATPARTEAAPDGAAGVRASPLAAVSLLLVLVVVAVVVARRRGRGPGQGGDD